MDKLILFLFIAFVLSCKKDTNTLAPLPPVAIAATSVTQNSFNAGWGVVNGATSYLLDVSKDNFVSFVFGYNNLKVTGTLQAVSGLTAGMTYQLRVRAQNSSGQISSFSNIITVATLVAPLQAPMAAGATSITPTGFTANWGAVSGSTGYFLDVSKDNFSSFVAGYNNLLVTGLLQAVSGLTSGTTYQYRVRAFNSSGVSPNSNQVSATTLSITTSATLGYFSIANLWTGNYLSVTNGAVVANTQAKDYWEAIPYKVNGVDFDSALVFLKHKSTGEYLFVSALGPQTAPPAFSLSIPSVPFLMAHINGNGYSSGYRQIQLAPIIGSPTIALNVEQGTLVFGPIKDSAWSAEWIFSPQSTDPIPIITFATKNSFKCAIGNTSCSNTATSSIASGGPISYSSSNPNIATVNSTTGAITPLALGVAVITASQAAKPGTNAPWAASYNLTIAAVSNDPVAVLTFANGTSYSCQVGSAACSNIATSSINNGGTITYSVDNASVATINATSGIITPLSAGNAIITATQSAKPGINSQASASYTLTVSSTDAWVIKTIDTYAWFNSVVYGNGLWIVGGKREDPTSHTTYPCIWTSSDANSWNPITLSVYGGIQTPAINKVSYGNGLYVAIGQTSDGFGFMLNSTNGNDWVPITYPANYQTSHQAILQDVTFGNGLWMAVGNGYVFKSSNGNNWSAQPIYVTGTRRPTLTDVRFGNNAWIITGSDVANYNPFLSSSSDGANWKNLQFINTSASWVGPVRYINSKWVAFAASVNGGVLGVFTSADASNWLFNSIPISGLNTFDFAYGNALWMAVGNHGAEASSFATSLDGLSWSRQTISNNPGYLSSICFANNKWVIVTQSGRILTK